MQKTNFATWKDEMKFLKLNSLKEKYPGAFMASGGWNQKIKPYTDKNTNGLTTCVKDFLTYHGHYAIRTNRQGQAHVEYIPIGGTAKNQMTGKGVKYNQKVKWTKNPEGKAFTDLQATINGLYIAIEIKCKATGDTIKDDQKKNKQLVEQSGGIHLFVTDMEMFWKWYYNELQQILKSKLK